MFRLTLRIYMSLKVYYKASKELSDTIKESTLKVNNLKEKENKSRLWNSQVCTTIFLDPIKFIQDAQTSFAKYSIQNTFSSKL